jgi:predicted small lipoprotein YifL
MKQIISFAICCLLLSNCGLKRPLTLPEEPKEIKVEMEIG